MIKSWGREGQSKASVIGDVFQPPYDYNSFHHIFLSLVLGLNLFWFCLYASFILCATDPGQEVGNTRLTRAIILAKLLLVICKRRRPAACLKVRASKQQWKKPNCCCFLQPHSCCFHTDCSTQRTMRPGPDPDIKRERNKQQNSWWKLLGWIIPMYSKCKWAVGHT